MQEPTPSELALLHARLDEAEQRSESAERRSHSAEARALRAERKGRVRSLLGVVALVVALTMSSAPKAAAQLGVTLASLSAQVSGLRTDLTAEANAREGADAAFRSRVTVLETKTRYQLVLGGNTIFRGTNVLVQSGLGRTDEVNGLGNLIVGYNENIRDYDRTGSHNLVVGDEHGYSSYGGAVFGSYNRIEGPYASVLVGEENVASGQFSAVSGGKDNTASGYGCVVSGGTENTASGYNNVVTGGYANTADGDYNVVSGGVRNVASDYSTYCVVGGGIGRTEERYAGWVGNDLATEVSARASAVATLTSGLASETSTRAGADSALGSRASALETKTQYLSVTGTNTVFRGTNVFVQSGSGSTGGTLNGLGNLIVGYNENALGYERTGSHNLVVGSGHGYSSFGGAVLGVNNRTSNHFALVLGGIGNQATGDTSVVTGGGGNTASGDRSVVSGGQTNVASGNVCAVSGGINNVASSLYSVVSGGAGNTAGGAASVVGGGLNLTETRGYGWRASSTFGN